MTSCKRQVCCACRLSKVWWKSLNWVRRACWKRSERVCRSVRCCERRSVWEVRRDERSDWRAREWVWRAVSWEVRFYN